MIHLDSRNFKDEYGRTLMLRGVNLGGSSKVPVQPDGATWNKAGFYDHRHVSFVGRPFPLAEADEHFNRLRNWGFTFLRFLVTWEAIEHAGPGIYDEAYLDYVRAIVEKAAEYGIQVFIDPHEDVWSRFTGGDGAPGWTLEAAGFDLTKIHATGAAILHQEYGDPFPRMVWPTNNNKLAAATMFTLFFAGNDFAPLLKVDGEPIQDYLQRHYIAAIQQVALRLRGLPNVAGYDTLNEPANGWISEPDLRKPGQSVPALIGASPTIFQSMLLGAGIPQRVDCYAVGLASFKKTGQVLLNPQAERVWWEGQADVWRQHGVWDLDSHGQPVLLKPDYFTKVNGRSVNFDEDYFKPFANRFAREIRALAPEALIFVESVPSFTNLHWGSQDETQIVHVPHWYDAVTVLKKTFLPWFTVDADTRRLVFGAANVRRDFAAQLGRLLRQADEQMNGAPTLLGEVGIPFDLDGGKAFRSADFSRQVQALDATMAALEMNCLSFTLWNYTADNTNQRGDLWNDEDFSLFSRDQQNGSHTVYDGGRALEAALRPYPMATAGQPLRLAFDIRSKRFEYTFRGDDGVVAPTEIFVPDYQYPRGLSVEVSDGSYEFDREAQVVRYIQTPGREAHTIRIRPET
ncbi:endoglucanase [Longilinea arvoryzae]|uniref:Endoglucanase n=1 Tax=Longilinea arvoryzae TaxID=360412 RepID=A0A0S7BGJ9_9CHLR|nr:cellulase family glycosylhydrolase [Longilinea arvoryzae]GAP12570.1 endoglucanase [Longilinea arvoryzae]